jgi:hypothetical protein
MVIGRKLFGSYLFPLFLNIGLMLPINHISASVDSVNNTPLLIVYLSFIPSSNVSKVKIKNYFVLSWTLKKRSTKSGVKHYGTNFNSGVLFTESTLAFV